MYTHTDIDPPTRRKPEGVLQLGECLCVGVTSSDLALGFSWTVLMLINVNFA